MSSKDTLQVAHVPFRPLTPRFPSLHPLPQTCAGPYLQKMSAAYAYPVDAPQVGTAMALLSCARLPHTPRARPTAHPGQ